MPAKTPPFLPYLKTLLLTLSIMTITFFLGACHKPSNNYEKPSRPADQKQAHQKKESGLMLDTARHFYPVDVMKSYIDTIAASGGTFLHLHFSDDENYALESPLLGQRAADAVVGADGIHINPKTGKPFLSYAQLRELIRHAKSKNIELIPEVGSPSHMAGIFTLLTHKHSVDYVRALQSKVTSDEIDITNPESIAFVKSLLTETIQAFGNSSRHVHIGGDEFGYSVESNHEFIEYANSLAKFLANKGLKTRMWNDGLITPTFRNLNRNIEITYWSYDGNPSNPDTAAERRKIRASMPDLINNGFKVLNYNSYFLYVVPSAKRNFIHDTDFATDDLKQRWHLGVWDGENFDNTIEDTDKILGAALAIWGENSGALDSHDIQRHTTEMLENVIQKTRAQSEKP